MPDESSFSLVPCPSLGDLMQFAHGNMDDESIETIADHLALCPTCRNLIEQGAESSTLAQIRAVKYDKFSNEREFQEGLDHVKALVGSSAQRSRPTLQIRATLPERFGVYEVLSRIGHGGMGTVFKARHSKLRKPVAIKVLHDTPSHRDAIVRFHREMEAVGRLNHQNIVGATDAGEILGVHFLAMEFVDGANLDELVRRDGPLPLELACSITKQAAVGLAFAHERGLIHRDIKPSNLMLGNDGVVKLLDLGLAHLSTCDSGLHESIDSSLTDANSVMGTVDFMSPEQALGAKHVDRRADIYSLGCTFYFLLTGKRMFGEGNSMQRLVAHREQPIPRIQDTRNHFPCDVDRVFRRMVAKQPIDRYASMEEVIEALDSIAHSTSKNATVAKYLCVAGVIIAVACGVFAYRARSHSPLTRRHPNQVVGHATQYDHEREVAHWVLSLGGLVRVIRGGDRVLIDLPASLPAEPFTIAEIELHHPSINDEDMRRFSQLTQLGMLDVDGTQVGDKGLLIVAGLRTLRNISVSNCRVTGRALPALISRDLYGLSVGQSSLTDNDVAVIGQMPNLQWLYLGDTAITDRSIAYISQLERLSTVNLQRTQISRAGIERLKALRPDCRIESDFETYLPESP